MKDGRKDDWVEQLGNWPGVERTEFDREAEVSRVAHQLAAKLPAKSLSDVSDDQLLAAPFPETDDEIKASARRSSPPPAGINMTPSPPDTQSTKNAASKSAASKNMSNPNPSSKSPIARAASSSAPLSERPSQQMRDRDRASLRELAKFAQTPAPSSVAAVPSAAVLEGDSGLVDLKTVAMLDPQGAERAKSTPLAATGLMDDAYEGGQRISGPPATMPSAAVPSSPPATAAEAVATSAPPKENSKEAIAPAPIMAPAVSPAAREVAKKESGVGLAIGGGIVAVVAFAAAAGYFIFARSPKFELAKRDLSAPIAVAPMEHEVQGPALVKEEAPPIAATEPANEAKAEAKPAARPAAGGIKVAAKSEAAEKPAEKPVEKAPAMPMASGDLGAAMAKAAGPIHAAKASTDEASGPKFAPGSVPQKPSQGQVTGAIGTVLPNARACLGPDDPVSKANVVFQSDGSVQSVGITGAAAGKPQEACIRNALKHAKVQPFMEATFSFPVTVRP